MKESIIQQRIRLAAARRGAVLFRNNIGAYLDDDGRLVRYGVCNPGGADLIGWLPVEITPDMVGQKVAIFVGIECKGAAGRVTAHQRNFIEQVRAAGGRAGIAKGDDEAEQILCGEY